MLITSSDEISVLAQSKEAENIRFKTYLQQADSKLIDSLVQEFNAVVEAQIDCTLCGNCCKTLMINVTEQEADDLSAYKKQTRADFDSQFLEKGTHGMMLMNTIPCPFLQENKCAVYEHRFAGCREFPGLHLPEFTGRLFSVFMHYGRCPIIFNVVEQLKEAMSFPTFPQ